MSDKSINLLSGMLSTKKLPASGMLKTTNSSIKEDHDKNSFLDKLVNSIGNTQTHDGQTPTDTPSETNSIKNIQTSDEQTANDIPSEATKTTDTDDINYIIKLLSLGLQTNPNQTANTDGNQAQLNPEVNQNIHGNEFTNAIINNSSNNKTSTARTGTSTLLVENALLNNQELQSLSAPNTNTAQNQTKELIPEPAASFSAKLDPAQVTTPVTQQIPGGIEHEQAQLQTAPTDKLNTTQNNTKMGKQRILDSINSSGLSEAATESKGEESTLQLSKLPARQATDPSGNNLNKSLNRTDITGDQNPVPSIEKAISNNKIINLNTTPHTDESANNKTNEMVKGLPQDKSLPATADKNPQTKQSFAQAHKENDEKPKIFEASTNTTDSKTAKSFDNTTLANNNGVSTTEAAMSSNTSSDNSTFNNQGTDTEHDFNLNTVNNSQKTRPETNFNNTLSQFNNSAKPLGALGNDVADNIIQSAKLYTLGGKSEIKMQLNPPELGTLKLEFTYNDDILETKITVERSSVKDVIEKDIPRLRELISNSDIDVGKLDVALQEKENSRQDFMNKDFHSNSKNKTTQDFPNQENEYHEDNVSEETMANNTESTQINYLV